MFFGLALLAAVIEAAAGYPDLVYRTIGHPVTWIARVITWADDTWNAEGGDDMEARLQGVVLVVLLLAGGLLGGLIVSRLLLHLLPYYVGLLILAVLASTLVAQRSLAQHVIAVADALDVRGLEAGREAVAQVVGRDTADLDEAGVARAAIESLAESFSDGVVAPLFWMALVGLPGALAYKAINTADSMIGHKTDRHIAFGWAAARTDDLVNLPASRLAALLLAVAANGQAGLSMSRALKTAWRDAGKHDSPNAGWPEAAMAGALGIRLMGPRTYDSETVESAWLGEGRAATKKDIRSALALYRTACGIEIGVLAILFALSFLL
jgi:adenosylcobinamide-phosphate synthase